MAPEIFDTPGYQSLEPPPIYMRPGSLDLRSPHSHHQAISANLIGTFCLFIYDLPL